MIYYHLRPSIFIWRFVLVHSLILEELLKVNLIDTKIVKYARYGCVKKEVRRCCSVLGIESQASSFALLMSNSVLIHMLYIW